MTHTPITLTEDQCYEAIERWQDYARFMYHTERGVALYASNVVEHEGRHVSFSIEPDGRIAVTRKEDGVKAVYDTCIVPAPVRSATDLDNVRYQARVATVDPFSAEDSDYFKGVIWSVVSLFQRTVANQFIANMTPDTMRIIAHDLALATPKIPQTLSHDNPTRP